MMQIIISPAKKMNIQTDLLPVKSMPVFREDADRLREEICGMSYERLKALWKCNDKLVELNAERFRNMDLTRQLTPAILAYEGLQYQHMKPAVFTFGEFDYIEQHLRILSGFYGVLSPFDGVTPYRLEMQAKLSVGSHKNLYEFWGNRIYHEITVQDKVLINLASKEYYKAIEPWLAPDCRVITCSFVEEQEGKLIQKGTLAKMARGEMVRFLAENKVQDPEQMKEFTALGFHFDQERSTESLLCWAK